jgi:hypothetical protein
MGLFDGCFVTMMGPIAFDICGPTGAGQAIGQQQYKTEKSTSVLIFNLFGHFIIHLIDKGKKHNSHPFNM